MNSLTPFILAKIARKQVYRNILDGLNGLHQQEVHRGQGYLPNFIIIGAAKSATTTLATILPRHPDCFISHPKEPKFFGRRYDRGWSWYRKIFRPGRGYLLRGEASTMYASPLGSFRYTPQLIHHCLPDVKIVYVVRHPLDRLVSHWRHLKGRRPGFVRFDQILSKRHPSKLLIGCSSYYARIQEFRRFFPDDQIHCLTFEDLISEPTLVLSALLKFLGAPILPDFLLDEGRLPVVNEAGDKGRTYVGLPEWPVGMRKKVVDLLRPDAESFLSYIGKPQDYWTW
ncbi:MAG: sulfotransferase [Prochlorococcaceae cyanobacterium]